LLAGASLIAASRDEAFLMAANDENVLRVRICCLAWQLLTCQEKNSRAWAIGSMAKCRTLRPPPVLAIGISSREGAGAVNGMEPAVAEVWQAMTP